MKNKKTTYDIITDNFIKALEAGTCPWKMPWSKMALTPLNAHSKKAYSGINFLSLASAFYASPYFATFKQLQELGGQVKKGEKASPVCYFSFIEKDIRTGKKATKETPKELIEKIPFLRYSNVFNFTQCDGVSQALPAKYSKLDFKPIERAETVLNSWYEKPAIKHGMQQACYMPADDMVMMPVKSSFNSESEYYAAIFHELAHSTAHESRLNRPLESHMMDRESYAKEELIAELTSSFIMAHCRIDNDTFDNSASYLQSWLKALKNDPKMIVQACSKASKAFEMIVGCKLGE